MRRIVETLSPLAPIVWPSYKRNPKWMPFQAKNKWIENSNEVLCTSWENFRTWYYRSSVVDHPISEGGRFDLLSINKVWSTRPSSSYVFPSSINLKLYEIHWFSFLLISTKLSAHKGQFFLISNIYLLDKLWQTLEIFHVYFFNYAQSVERFFFRQNSL